ncbi:cytochrome P450 [Melanogaster broomeanus]|nr:cytochrome P450 [Melanogaster broomeanus]
MLLSLDVSSALTIGVIAAGLIVLVKLAKPRRKTQGLCLPGPTPLPLVGNALSIKAAEPWVTYTEWGLAMARMFSENVIIINSEKVARALLDRRSNIYSDRPNLVTRVPLTSYGWAFHFAWQPYGEQWRTRRKFLHQFFRAEASLDYHPIQLKKARQLVLDLVKSPGDYPIHLQRFSAAIIMSLLYDYEISPGKDHFVELFERGASVAFKALLPENASIVATFPFVLSLPTWFPGAVFSRRAALSKKCAEEMLSAPFEYVRKREADGDTSSALVFNLLRSEKHMDDPSAYELIKEVAATGFIASTLHSFLLALVLNPEVQKRAQAEIDDVVGMDRLPNFDDRPFLPYVEAVLRETLRMYPIAPLSIAHATVSDDIFEGYFIPKGSTIVPNVWAMLRDPETYPEPNSFKPERYFQDGKLDDEPSTSNLGYGFGRRVCPGRYTADASVWAGMVTFLSTMTISKALDAQGREIDVKPVFTCSVSSCPAPFPCAIVPRRAGFDATKFSKQMIDV